jgi:formyltetrahydrofolate deformylase
VSAAVGPASPTATLLISCPDQRGLVARTSKFVADRNGNLVHAEHHIDPSTGLFLMRIEWELDGFELARDEIAPAFTPLAEQIHATWQLHFSDTVRRMAISATSSSVSAGASCAPRSSW